MKQVVEFTNKQNLYVEAHIADIHFGVIDPKVQYNLLESQFLFYLEQMNVLDIVSINGDLFDHKFMASSEAVMYANYFIGRLVDICRKKRATLILISGTGSHDANQLNLFAYLMRDPTVDVRVIMNDAQFIYVKGKKILCIPELYNKGEEYYNSLLNSGVYDSCYMHGTFVGAIYGKNERDLNSEREPVFDIEDFGMCRGPIISGHVHIAGSYKQDFYYSGSPLRWCFGEEQTKGFLILIHQPTTRQYYIHMEPITSFQYVTVNLDHMLNDDPKKVIDYVADMKANGVDYVRVKFTKNIAEKVNLIKQYYRTKPDIKIDTNFEQIKIQQELDTLNTEYQQYDYLFDKNLSPEQILVQYINKDLKDEYWTVDTLKEFLHSIEKI